MAGDVIGEFLEWYRNLSVLEETAATARRHFHGGFIESVNHLIV